MASVEERVRVSEMFSRSFMKLQRALSFHAIAPPGCITQAAARASLVIFFPLCILKRLSALGLVNLMNN